MANIQVLVLSDTHNDAFPDPGSIPSVDVVLHCGDLTMAGGKSNYIKALQLLGQIEAELKLVIAGNHDLSLDPDWWQANLDDDDNPSEPDEMKKLMQSQAENGVQYLEEGTHFFKLKNGTDFSVYASPYTPEFNGYAFGYPHEEDRFNNRAAVNPIPENVDIIMSHGPPRFPHDETCEPYTLDMNESLKHVGCPHLFRAIQRVRPLLHCFGHIHEGYGAQMAVWEQGNALALPNVKSELENGLRRLISTEAMSRGTLLINAALKVHGSQHNNHPWILNLPLRSQPGNANQKNLACCDSVRRKARHIFAATTEMK